MIARDERILAPRAGDHPARPGDPVRLESCSDGRFWVLRRLTPTGEAR